MCVCGGGCRRSGCTRVPQYGDTREFTERRADAARRKLAENAAYKWNNWQKFTLTAAEEMPE